MKTIRTAESAERFFLQNTSGGAVIEKPNGDMKKCYTYRDALEFLRS